MAPTKHKALINVDMGEAYGNYSCGPDKELLPMIDHANVACGFQYATPVTVDTQSHWEERAIGQC